MMSGTDVGAQSEGGRTPWLSAVSGCEPSSGAFVHFGVFGVVFFVFHTLHIHASSSPHAHAHTCTLCFGQGAIILLRRFVGLATAQCLGDAA